MSFLDMAKIANTIKPKPVNYGYNYIFHYDNGRSITYYNITKAYEEKNVYLSSWHDNGVQISSKRIVETVKEKATEKGPCFCFRALYYDCLRIMLKDGSFQHRKKKKHYKMLEEMWLAEP